jgi:chromosome segregation ATPase
MEVILTIDEVRGAIQKLKGEGERVTRRNVLAVTGGSMSTVHRMMSQIEDTEAKAAASSFGGISESLNRAIREEVDQNIQKETKVLQDQIALLRDREKQALDALAAVELRADRLAQDLESTRSKTGQEKIELEKCMAVARETILSLEQKVDAGNRDRFQLTESAGSDRQEASMLKFQLEREEQIAAKLEEKNEQLIAVLSAEKKALAQAEKDAAVAHQRAADLSAALEKTERAQGSQNKSGYPKRRQGNRTSN